MESVTHDPMFLGTGLVLLILAVLIPTAVLLLRKPESGGPTEDSENSKMDAPWAEKRVSATPTRRITVEFVHHRAPEVEDSMVRQIEREIANVGGYDVMVVSGPDKA